MKTFDLLENAKFAAVDPHAEPLYVDKLGRVLLYALRPGRLVREHNAPHPPRSCPYHFHPVSFKPS